jgi:hypothetical protein
MNDKTKQYYDNLKVIVKKSADIIKDLHDIYWLKFPSDNDREDLENIIIKILKLNKKSCRQLCQLKGLK